MTTNSEMNYQFVLTTSPEFQLLNTTSNISSHISTTQQQQQQQFAERELVKDGGLVLTSIGNSTQTYVNTALNFTLGTTLKQVQIHNVTPQKIYSKQPNGSTNATPGSQSYAFAREVAETEVTRAAASAGTRTAAVDSNGGTGSRSFSFIPKFAEFEVDGLGPAPPSIFPQQLTNYNNEKALLIKEPVSTHPLGGNQCPEKDILENAVSVIDPEYLVDAWGEGRLDEVDDIPNLDTNEISFLLKDNADEAVANPEGSLLDTFSQFDLASVPPPPCPDNSSVTFDDQPIPVAAKKTKKNIREDEEESDGSSNHPRAKKQRLWEVQEPFEDKEMEKKRQDAIRAKKNRERSKTGKKTLQEELNALKSTHDALKKEVLQLKAKSEALEMALKRRYTLNVQNTNIEGRDTIIVYVPVKSSNSPNALESLPTKDVDPQITQMMNLF